MTKVTLNENSPTAQVVAKAAATHVVHDARGRKITLRKPAVLQQFRLVEILGDTAKNETYMAMAFPILYVTEIDDEPAVISAKKSEFEALIARLDEDGITAVVQGVQEHFGTPDPEAGKAAIKK